MRGLPTRLLTLFACLVGASPSYALIDDPFTTKTQPANTLVMPFDATTGRTTFLLVSNLNGTSGSGVGAVTTHWSFWSDSCTHLLDVPICLTLNDTIVVDPTNVAPIDAANHAQATSADLTGNRGFVTVTAYKTDANCADASVESFQLVDDALVGTMTLADSALGKAFAIDAVGLGVDPSGSFVELPNLLLSPDGSSGFLDIDTFNPGTVDESIVILLALKENAGALPGEVGGIGAPVTANVAFYDNLEIHTSLPDTSIPCALFSSTVPSATGSLVPATVTLDSSGFVQLTNIKVGSTPVGNPDGSGRGTWVYGFHAQVVDKYSAASSAKYQVIDAGAVPSPTPTAAPTPTPGATQTPGTSPTPGTSATPAATPTPRATATAAVSPTPGTSATPGPTPTPGSTATAAPTATPTPTANGASCTSLNLTIAVNYNALDFPSVSGVAVAVAYPTSVAIPGTGNEASVLARVTNLTGVSGGLFSVGDQDDKVNIGLVSISQTIPSGNFAKVQFDCTPGASAPPASAFTCTPDVSTLDGTPVTAQCALTASPVK